MSPGEQNCPWLRTTGIGKGALEWGVSIQLPYSPRSLLKAAKKYWDKIEINNINIINNVMIMLTNNIECLTMCQGAKLLTFIISFNPITKSMRWKKLSSSFYR